LTLSLLSGAVFVPYQTKAESADTALAPVMSCQAFLEDKKEEVVETSAIVNISDSGDCLVPAVSHKDIPGGDSSDLSSVYVVRSGDSIPVIAKLFNVTPQTIYWGNDLKIGDKIKEGQVLVILPISGIEYTVKKGDTLASIAKANKADAQDIASYNGITENTSLVVGGELIIPDAQMSDEGGDKPAPNLKESTKKDKDYYAKNPSIKNSAGTYINPVPAGHKTQGLHNGVAIDIGAPIGTPIYASAAGRVIIAKTGWNGGYGNFVVIKNSNGTEARYAHQSRLAVHAGESVSQGEVIGYVGNTGHSTGPHLHFELRGGVQNPGVKWSWKPWTYKR